MAGTLYKRVLGLGALCCGYRGLWDRLGVLLGPKYSECLGLPNVKDSRCNGRHSCPIFRVGTLTKFCIHTSTMSAVQKQNDKALYIACYSALARPELRLCCFRTDDLWGLAWKRQQSATAAWLPCWLHGDRHLQSPTCQIYKIALCAKRWETLAT